MKQEFAAILTSSGHWAICSVEDFDRFKCLRWHTRASRDNSESRYPATNVNRRQLAMHRFILDPPKPLEVDHINRNPLDNRRENLRVVTRSQNMVNRREWRESGKLPRCIHKKGTRYRLEIRRDNRKAVQKYFKTVEEAVLFRDGYFACEGILKTA